MKVYSLACLTAATLLAWLSPATAQDRPNTPGSFSTAKRKAFEEVYHDHRTTFYCDCGFKEDKSLDVSECGYVPLDPFEADGDPNARAHRMEWEHIVPAARFGRTRKCWLEREEFPECEKDDGKLLSGRKCCGKVDEVFEAAEGDMMNLRPAVGELNADRSDLPYGVIEGEILEYGDCDFEIQEGVIEPDEPDRGEIARTYLYFERIWGMTLTAEERELFQRWHEEDLPDDWEKTRNERIKAIQGIGNPFVEDPDVTADCILRSQCCRVCKTSQACGDACISTSVTCRLEEPGCACDADRLCQSP